MNDTNRHRKIMRLSKYIKESDRPTNYEKQNLKIITWPAVILPIIRSSDNDRTGLWPPGSLHTLGVDGHI